MVFTGLFVVRTPIGQPRHAGVIRRDLLTPLAEDMAGVAASRARKAAATKVDFFTMVRGED